VTIFFAAPGGWRRFEWRSVAAALQSLPRCNVRNVLRGIGLVPAGDGAGHECSCRFIRLHRAVCRPFGRINRQGWSPLVVAAHTRFVRALPSGASLHARTGAQVAGEARGGRQETRTLIEPHGAPHTEPFTPA